MPYVNVPNDLSKIKTKIAFNLTKRQLVCFGCAAAVGIPSYLFARGSIGNTGAMFAMLVIMLPAFLLAMYEKDGLPAEKVVKNIIRARFTRPGVRPYQTQNIYAPFTGRGTVRKEDAIADHKTKRTAQGRQRQKAGGPVRPAVNPILEQMKSVDIGAVAPESLADVSGMTFNNALPKEERIACFLQAVKNPYCFCIGGVGVKIEFAESGPSLQDTLTDFLLRQKSGL